MFARKRKKNIYMIVFNCAKEENELRQELNRELKPEHRNSFNIILKYLQEYNAGRLDESDTYDKIQEHYRCILAIYNNEKIMRLLELCKCKYLFIKNIFRTKRDIGGKSSF